MSKYIITITFAASFLVVTNVRADVVTLYRDLNSTIPAPYEMYVPLAKYYSSADIKVGHNVTDDLPIQFYCADITIDQRSNFQNPSLGHQFRAIPLDNVHSSIMSNNQRDAIQSLFNHVYNPLLTAQDLYFDLMASDPNRYNQATQQAWNDVTILNASLQVAIWKIAHATTAQANDNDWNATARIDPTDVRYRGTTPWEDMYPYIMSPTDVQDAILDLTFGWLDSVTTGIWEESFAAEYLYEVTYYQSTGLLSNTRSQPLLSVTGGGDSNVVPEPATIAVLGLGLAGLGWTRIRRKK